MGKKLHYMFNSLVYAFFVISISKLIECKIPLNGAGASLPAEVYTTWMAAFKAHRNQFVEMEMTYNARGSGHGKSRIKNELEPEVEYAGSDSLLTEEDYENHPQLQMFPTLAGPVVLAFNIPGVEELVLSREIIVGIYNGSISHWDNPLLVKHNQGASLPNEVIRPAARGDKSGMTEIFTTALSMFSPEWEYTKGAFSHGIDDSGKPMHWDPDVVKLFGKRVYGITDTIKDVDYSIGYTTQYLAQQVGLPFASIINKAGKVVQPSPSAIQSAMDNKASLMSDRLTVSLVDAPGVDSYPLSDFTYLIVRMSAADKCDSYTALVRYIQWFLSDKQPIEEAKTFGMIPVSDTILTRIKHTVIGKMTCNGVSVLKTAEQQESDEQYSMQTWRTPVAIVAPLVGCVILALCGYLIFQRVQYLKKLDSNAWDISIEDITFIFPSKRETSMGMSRYGSSLNGSIGSSSPSSSESGVESVIVEKVLHWPGKWEGHMIGLRVMQVPETPHITKDISRELMWMRDKIFFENVVRFYGLTTVDNDRFVINEFCPKGALNDVLQNEKFKINLSFKFSLSTDIAKGMTFLHQNGITHGNLNSSCCLLDSRWTVKISDWEHLRLFTSIMRKKKVAKHAHGVPVADSEKNNPMLYIRMVCEQERGTHAKVFQDLWTAPEILKEGYLIPATQQSDMYSYAIVVQEIFTRADPYVELTDRLEAKELLLSIQFQNLRPQHGEETPIKVRQIMEIGWNDTPSARPTFDQVYKMLRSANPGKKSVLENMMEAMEDYTRSLEEKVEQHSESADATRQNLESMLTRFLPATIAQKLSIGQSVQPEVFSSVSIAFIQIHMFSVLASCITPSEIIQFLSSIQQILDLHLADKHVHFLSERCDSFTLISGVSGHKDHAKVLADTCFDIKHSLQKLQHPFSSISMESNILQSAKNAYSRTNIYDMAKGNVTTESSISMGKDLTICISDWVKIVIHAGPISTGVVGSSVPRFLLYGDTLWDTQSLLASRAQAGNILISEQMWKLLNKHQYSYCATKHERIKLESGEVSTYWLTQSISTEEERMTRTETTLTEVAAQ